MRKKHRDEINSKLPDDIMMKIFNKLDSKSNRDASSLVCKRWRTLERITRQTVRIGGKATPDSFVKLIATCFVNVTNLIIDESKSGAHPYGFGRRLSSRQPQWLRLNFVAEKFVTYCLSDDGMAAIADGYSRLEKLTLIWCTNVTNAGFRSIAGKCRSLKCLDLQGSYIEDEGLAAIVECCKELEVLKLRFCERLTNAGLVGLAIGCGKTLKSLGIANCAKLTNVSLKAVGSHCRSLETFSLNSEDMYNDLNEGVIAVAKGCSHLKKIELQDMMITDEALSVVGIFCVLLETLKLSEQIISDKSLRDIGKGCKKLRSLILRSCFFVTDKGIDAVASGCPELSHLEVNSCSITKRVLESITRSCMRLTVLSLINCKDVGDDAISEVGKGCNYLQALHLEVCEAIGDDVICNLAVGCKYLKKLYVYKCPEVGSKGIIDIAENCKYLEDLRLHSCSRVGDEALVAIGYGCPLLSHLDVSACNDIGDVGITAIARGCPQLTFLDARFLKNLSDMALGEVGEGCPLLKELDTCGCPKITDVGLANLIRGCKLLESFDIRDCPGVTATGVATVISSSANIKKLRIEKSKVSERTQRRARSTIISF